MIRRKRIAVYAVLFLLLALCIPAFSGALAADEIWIDIPVGRETTVSNEEGETIGVLQPTQESGIVFQANTGERITGVRVQYKLATVTSAKQNEALTGKTKVQLSLVQQDASATEPAATEAATILPESGWIDSNLVITALSARIAMDASRTEKNEAEIAALTEKLAKVQESQTNDPAPTANPILASEQKNTELWIPYAALTLGIVCVGALGWIALSTYAAKIEKEHQTDQLKKLNEHFAKGIPVKEPLKMELNSWPRNARVEIVSDALDHMAKREGQNAGYSVHPTPVEPAKPVELPPVPEGEEPELLKLANSLVGVAASATWRNIVSEAGFRYALLQANPTEKGTYIADDSGFSIIAALMRGAEADIAYIVPSYQDPNASEKRWHDFYSITESESVRRYRVDALPVMFIENGVFFLPKSKGRLTRRP